MYYKIKSLTSLLDMIVNTIDLSLNIMFKKLSSESNSKHF